MYRIAFLLALAATVLVGSPARASDPIGGFMLVDRVVLAPSGAPTTIRIWGSFALATQRGSRVYGAPQRGYLYYRAPQGKEELCRKEWNDIKKAAGTNQVLGFGSSEELKALGKVRTAHTSPEPEVPDVYPLA